MQRIIIVGSTGSGKTHLARQIAARLGLPYHDLDQLYWLPGWQPRTQDDFTAQVAAATASPNWIVTGNYRLVRDIVWTRGDTLIWLDYSFTRTFWQLLKRTARNIFHHETVCNGNQETLRLQLSRKSIFLWLLQTYRRNRTQYGAVFADGTTYAQLKRIHLQSPRQTAAWVQAVMPPSP